MLCGHLIVKLNSDWILDNTTMTLYKWKNKKRKEVETHVQFGNNSEDSKIHMFKNTPPDIIEQACNTIKLYRGLLVC